MDILNFSSNLGEPISNMKESKNVCSLKIDDFPLTCQKQKIYYLWIKSRRAGIHPTKCKSGESMTKSTPLYKKT